jgi:hypothetical protein
MKTKHIFIPALDVGELLPFAIKKEKNLQKYFEEQERAKKELVRFIDILEKKFKEPIYYLGMDVIGEKAYERFLFRDGGFFEVMTETPIALNAHFVNKKRAGIFKNALKETLRTIIPKNDMAKHFIDSIKVQDEKDQSLTVETWHKIKDL